MLTAKLHALYVRVINAFSVLVGTAVCYPNKLYKYHSLVFSQEGEDGVLDRLFGGKPHGFYVDVGSHHPQRYSNTYLFYLRGWHGINIDPLPGTKIRFDLLRKRELMVIEPNI